jgi:hypothetical protein
MNDDRYSIRDTALVNSVVTICGLAAVAIVPLIAAAWLIPPGFPYLLRQLILCAWGTGTVLLAEQSGTGSAPHPRTRFARWDSFQRDGRS